MSSRSEGPFISGLFLLLFLSLAKGSCLCSILTASSNLGEPRLIPTSFLPPLYSLGSLGGLALVRSSGPCGPCPPGPMKSGGIFGAGGGGPPRCCMRPLINPPKPGFSLDIELAAACVNWLINSGFCLIMSSMPGIEDLNMVLVMCNIAALPPSINNNLISGAILAFCPYFSCNSPNTSS